MYRANTLNTMQGEHASNGNGIYVRTLRWLGRRRWFAAMGRRLAPVDTWLYRRTKGRIGLTGPTGRVYRPLLLTTTGRRTGRPRTTPVMYLRDGEAFVITSENFGQAKPAAWPLNLAANPDVTIQIGDRAVSCRARPATDEEVARLWPRFVEVWPAHESYLERSGVRHMFVLEPV